ncbi:MAG TPA: hypothetical protein VKG26_15435 [Bacteroidia bacterium]|nr:hypothetical protein [Bacteroidia bacterium]
MNIKEALLKEHSKTQTLKIVAYVGNDKKLFAELITRMLTAEYRIAQRAAWPVSYCIEAHAGLIKPWLSKMIKKLGEKNIHNAIKRNTLRVLADVDIPEKHCGTLYDISYAFLHDLNEPIAIRVFALSVLANVAKKYPELKKEVIHNA